MKDTEVKKRKWVMPAIIVFLSVMLVLTFFSNTIMNRSLPEVAAQYTQSGTITARIRGSGTVTANESFEVKLDQTRKVEEVPVRKGDEVNIGDVLIVLSGTDSAELDGLRSNLSDKELELENLLLEMSKGDNTISALVRAVTSARNSLSDAQNTLAGIQFNSAAYGAAQAEVDSAAATAAARLFDSQVADSELATLNSIIADGGTVDPAVLEAAQQKVRDTTAANSLAQASLTLANSNLAAAGNRDAWLMASSSVRQAQLNLDEANANLALAQSNASVDNSIEGVRLRVLKEEIDDLKEQVDKLEKEGNTTDIKSLVGGIVTDINVSPGNTTDPNDDTPLMIIEVVDRGYSLSFPVTADQASRVNVGDQADVDRGWWSRTDELNAQLVSIRTNPQDPITGRILNFSITGDVESDMQLNLTLAQRSVNYNVIVPNSALRSDTNGDFVLVVVSRPSPLGNRYIATRADINILASDDTSAAVSGALSEWEFVITRASAPIEPGMQVRLVDNP
ncbi:MAG: hypothetical protein FWD38_11080 [Oscillospiraceae bacterium]|nr:hypothetical protein [Oscillospiraceae bacterium]